MKAPLSGQAIDSAWHATVHTFPALPGTEKKYFSAAIGLKTNYSLVSGICCITYRRVF